MPLHLTGQRNLICAYLGAQTQLPLLRRTKLTLARRARRQKASQPVPPKPKGLPAVEVTGHARLLIAQHPNTECCEVGILDTLTPPLNCLTALQTFDSLRNNFREQYTRVTTRLGTRSCQSWPITNFA